MEVVDANVILRYLLGDVEELYKKAEEIFSQVIAGRRTIFIPQVVIAEVVYVLMKLYKVPKEKVVLSIEFFLNLKNCKIQDKKAVKEALKIFSANNISFVDALLCAYARANNYQLTTFDAKLLKVCR